MATGAKSMITQTVGTLLQAQVTLDLDCDDDAIDTNDIPELDDEFFRHAKIKTNHGKPAAMKFYADILSWLKYQGRRLAGSL